MLIPRIFTLFIAISFLSFSESMESVAYSYIDQYRDLAVVEMYRSGVPASITLAQGLHESQYGTSELARQANNHFGIKCKSSWSGKTYFYVDDDYDAHGNLMASCFRSYDSDHDSYIDHSNFLMARPHYQSLFTLPKYDYEGWAYGLKKCGYATDPDYAKKLINKIEKFNLDRYDHYENPLKVKSSQN